MIDHGPHLFRIQLDNSFNIFLLSQNFVTRCNHGHFSDLRVGRAEVFFEISFELFDDLLVVGEVDLFDSCQNKQRFVSHVGIQLDIFEGSGAEDGFAGPSIERDGLWSEWGQGGGDLIVDRECDSRFLLQRQYLKV